MGASLADPCPEAGRAQADLCGAAGGVEDAQADMCVAPEAMQQAPADLCVPHTRAWFVFFVLWTWLMRASGSVTPSSQLIRPISLALLADWNPGALNQRILFVVF